MPIEYQTMRREHIDGVVTCLMDSFLNREPMTRALALTDAAYRYFLEITAAKAADDGVSFVAVDAGQVVGCLLAEDLASPPPVGSERIDPSMAPLFGLLDELQGRLGQPGEIAPGQYLHLFMRGVVDGHEGQGIGGTLYRLVEDLGRAKGYRELINECTGARSQYLTEKAGGVMSGEIVYREFSYEGTRPFASIEAPPSCRLYRRVL